MLFLPVCSRNKACCEFFKAWFAFLHLWGLGPIRLSCSLCIGFGCFGRASGNLCSQRVVSKCGLGTDRPYRLCSRFVEGLIRMLLTRRPVAWPSKNGCLRRKLIGCRWISAWIDFLTGLLRSYFKTFLRSLPLAFTSHMRPRCCQNHPWSAQGYSFCWLTEALPYYEMTSASFWQMHCSHHKLKRQYF